MLDDVNLRINLSKCHFAKAKIERFGCKLAKSGISLLESKTSIFPKLSATKILKQLRSFLGSLHYLGKTIRKLSQMWHPLRPIIKKNIGN